MSRLNDLTGKTFGLLMVIYRAPDHISSSGIKRVKWHCKCDCGNEIDVLSSNLVAGKTISCGCYNEKIKKERYKDISGQRYGQLVALEPTNLRNKSGEIIWKCKCDCGKETTVSLGDLRNGHTTSCGCTRYTKIQKKLMKDLTGQKFNYLTVLYPIYNSDKTFSRKWHCKCDCGKEIDVYSQALGRQLSCGCINLSKGEYKIKNLLEENNIKYEMQKTFLDLKNKNNKHLRFDFCIYKNNQILCLLEYQGIQHFEEVEFFNKEDLKTRQENDQKKREYCKKNNIPLIEIPYNDYNILNWRYLSEKIETRIQ